MRIYPHQQDTGGFFIAVLEKKHDAPWENDKRYSLNRRLLPWESEADWQVTGALHCNIYKLYILLKITSIWKLGTNLTKCINPYSHFFMVFFSKPYKCLVKCP